MTDIAAKIAKRDARKSRRAEKLAEAAELAQAVSGAGPSLPDLASNVEAPEKQAKARGGHPGAKLNARSKPVGRKRRRKKYRAPTRRERDAYEATVKKYVEWRAMGRCDVCKINQGYAWYHIIPANEGQWAKWSIENIVWGCRDCNCKENNFRARYVDLHRMIFGYEFYGMLRENANKTVQFRADDFKRMRESLEMKMANGTRNGGTLEAKESE